MFLIRTAFWLSIVILLLPAEEPPGSPQASAGTQVSANSVIGAARNTISDIAGICERSPDVCETGGAAVDTFVKKARYGAGLVGRAIWGDDAAQEPARAVNYEAPQRPSVAQPASSQSTLQPEDRQPAWNGPVPDRPV
jgi:hypothetical protein